MCNMSGLRLAAGAFQWRRIFPGCAILARIGFTMSVFIAMLAFDETVPINAAKSGILAGSFLAGVVGAIVLRIASGFRNGE